MQANSQQTIENLLTESTPPMPNASQRATFEHGFDAELRHLEGLDRDLDTWQEETLLSALGAASINEYELASAFVEAVRRPPSPSPPARNFRRLPMPIATLRRRFERVKGTP